MSTRASRGVVLMDRLRGRVATRTAKPPHGGRKKFCRRDFGARRQRQQIRSDWPLARRRSAARQGSRGEACLDGRFTLPLTEPAAEGWWVCVAGRVLRVRVQPGTAPACGTCFDPWRGPPPLPDQQHDPARSSFVLSHTVPGFAGSPNGSYLHHACRAWPPRGTLHSAMACHCCGRGIRAWPCRLLGAPPERTEGGRVAFPPPPAPTTGPCNRTASSTARPGLAAYPSKIVQGIAGSGCRASRFSTETNPPPAKRWPTISHPQKRKPEGL